MTKNQLLALAAFITSLANDGECSTTTETVPAGGEAPPTKRRGRPPTTATPPPAESPVNPPPTEVAPPNEPAPTGSKTIDDMRALIQPLIKGQWMPGWKEGDPVQPRGGEVRPIIEKYAPTLIQMDPKDYAAFEKDIEALLY